MVIDKGVLNERAYSNRNNTQARVKTACKERGFNTESILGVKGIE